MRSQQLLRLTLASFWIVGCAGAAPSLSTPVDPSTEKTPAPVAGEPAPAAEPSADVLYAAHAAVPARSSTCVIGGNLPPVAACKEPHAALALGLAESGETRDRALAKLEPCREFPRGLLRALRAELGDPLCADALVEDVVGGGHSASDLPLDIRQTLVALGLGARLGRLASDPPAAPPKLGKAELEVYFKDSLFPYVTRQAQAIFVMASQGTRLQGYARGVVAIESGNADMRFVELVRNAPLATEIAEHEDAKDAYYVALDEQLEPRKARGRDAALVGLSEMARLGVLTSDRVKAARSLLSKVYGGRRINALDTLMLAGLPPEKAADAVAAIVSRVPTAYATSLSGPPQELTATHLRAYIQMGLPAATRRQAEASESGAAQLLLARALFESGRAYFRAEDFQRAAAISSALIDEPTKGKESFTPEQIEHARHLRALSVALSAGPKDATEMLARGPRFADQLGNLALLDGLSELKSELGGRAAFNAAYLRELVAPEGAPEYWADLGKRYLAASKKLKGSESATSQDRGKACLAIEKELRRR